MDKTNKASLRYAYSVYKAVANHWNIPMDDNAIAVIDDLPKAEVLADFLAWEGIIGYTDVILSIVNA